MMLSKKNYSRQCPVCHREIFFSLNRVSRVFKFSGDIFEREDNNDIFYPEDPYLEIFCSWDCSHDIDGTFTEEEKDDIKSQLIKSVKLEKLLKIDDDFKKEKNHLDDINFRESLDYFQRTYAHIREVGEGITRIINELNSRILGHDKSKIENENEVKGFINLNRDKEKKNFKFGSPEYTEALNKIKKVVGGHYLENRHHPEHWDNGIHDMDIVDIMEMLCDWASECKRDKDGDLMKSIDICCKKFGIESQLRLILEKTANNYFSDKIFISENPQTKKEK